jgi:hypothetical protein
MNLPIYLGKGLRAKGLGLGTGDPPYEDDSEEDREDHRHRDAVRHQSMAHGFGI